MKDRIWGYSRNVFFTGLTSFFNDFSSEMVLSVFPAFFKAVLKSGAASLGLVEGIADFASNIIKIYSGQLSDKVNKRRIFGILGYGLSTLTRPLYLFANTILPVVGLRLTDRIGKGLRESPRDALISLSVPKEELGRSFGFHRAMDTAGAVLGPLVAYIILRQYPGSFNKVFITAFFIGIVGVASFFLVKEVAGVMQKKGGLAPLKNFSTQYKYYLLSSFILYAGTMPLAILLLKTQDIGLIIADIPLFYMLYSIFYSVFSLAAGKAADRVGDKKVILLGYLLLVVSYWVLHFASGAWVLGVGFAVLGLFSALTDGVQRSYAGRLTGIENRGAAYGWLNGAAGIGAFIAGIGGGYTWQHYGSGPALFVASAIVIFGLVVFLASQRETIEK